MPPATLSSSITCCTASIAATLAVGWVTPKPKPVTRLASRFSSFLPARLPPKVTVQAAGVLVPVPVTEATVTFPAPIEPSASSAAWISAAAALIWIGAVVCPPKPSVNVPSVTCAGRVTLCTALTLCSGR